jgi:acyl-CoA thioesterase
VHTFDRGIHLEPAGPGRYVGSIEKHWWVEKGPNGGYIASVILNGLQLAIGDPGRSPRSFTVHYVSRPGEGDIEVQAAVERVGRSMTATTGRLLQEGRLIATAQCAFSAPRSAEEEFDDLGAPEVTQPEDIPELVVPEGTMPPFAAHFDYRWAIGTFPYSGAETAVTGGWLRPKEPRALDALILPTFADGWPPSVFSRRTKPALVPTIDLTVHLRSEIPELSPGEWVLVRFEARVASGGFLEEDGLMWTRDGKLLAQSRQLSLF